MSQLPPPLTHVEPLTEAKKLNVGRTRDRSIPRSVRKGATHTTEGEREKESTG